MSAWLNDAITAANNTNIDVYVGTDGATWISWYYPPGGAWPVIFGYASGDGVHSRMGAAIGGGPSIVRSSRIAPNASVTVSIPLYFGDTSYQFETGAFILMDTAGRYAYAAWYEASGGTPRFALYRYGDTAGGRTLLASVNVTAFAQFATPVLGLDAVVGASSVSLSVKVNGSAVLAFTDSSASRLTAPGYVGGGFYATTGGTGGFFDSYTADTPVGDTIAPTFVSAQVANASPSVIAVTMSEALSGTMAAAGAFSATVNGTARAVTGAASGGGAAVNLTLASPVAYSDVVQFAYAKPGSNPLADASGNQTASFGPVAVTNNVAQAAGTITLGEFRDPVTQQLRPNEAIARLTFQRLTDGTQVLNLSSQATNGSGILPAVSNIALVPGLAYMVSSWSADGALKGIKMHVAA